MQDMMKKNPISNPKEKWRPFQVAILFQIKTSPHCFYQSDGGCQGCCRLRLITPRRYWGPPRGTFSFQNRPDFSSLGTQPKESSGKRPFGRFSAANCRMGQNGIESWTV